MLSRIEEVCKAILQGILDFIRPVITLTVGRCVAMINGGTTQLCYADNALLTLVLARQHKISQLVNDYHQGGQSHFAGFLEALCCHTIVSAIHFGTYIFEGLNGISVVFDDRTGKMRKPLILGQLHFLGVNHNKLHCRRCATVKH